MVILRAQLIPGPEQALRLDGHAGDGNVVEASHGEERGGEVVPASAEGGLSCITSRPELERGRSTRPRPGASSSTRFGRQSVSIRYPRVWRDRLEVMVFPVITGESGSDPILSGLPDI